MSKALSLIEALKRFDAMLDEVNAPLEMYDCVFKASEVLKACQPAKYYDTFYKWVESYGYSIDGGK